MVREISCPFCMSSLADVFAHRAPRAAPPVRLGRAATFAFGMLAMSQGACGDNDTPGMPPEDAANIPPDAAPDAGTPADANYDGGDLPIYAAAPTRDGGTNSRG